MIGDRSSDGGVSRGDVTSDAENAADETFDEEEAYEEDDSKLLAMEEEDIPPGEGSSEDDCDGNSFSLLEATLTPAAADTEGMGRVSSDMDCKIWRLLAAEEEDPSMASRLLAALAE